MVHDDPTPLILSGQFVCLLRYRGYAVSVDGRVWTCRSSGPGNRDKFTDNWRPLSPGKIKGGYMTVALTKNQSPDLPREMKTRYVHELILEGFIGTRQEGFQCCHADGSRDNNRLDNLRWDTISANSMEKHRHGTMPINEKASRCKLTNDQVKEILRRAEGGETQTDLAKKFGIRQSTISRYRTKKRRLYLPWQAS